MKLRPDQLAAALQKNLASCYFVFGEELFLIEECVAQIRQSAKHHHINEHIRFQYDQHFNPESLVETSSTLSLFAEKRLIEINLLSASLSSAMVEELTRFFAQQTPQDHLLITAPKLDSKTQQSRWFKLIDEHGIVIQCWPLNAAQLQMWIRKRTQAADLKLSTQALAYFADHIEGNLFAAAQTIEKLALQFVNHTAEIQQADLQKIMEQNSQHDLYQFIDAVLVGDMARTLKILHRLQAQQPGELPLLIWLLAKEIRMMIDLIQGKSPPKTWQQHLNKLNQCQKRHSLMQLHHYLIDLQHIDSMVKGAIKDNPWNALQRLGLCLVNPQYKKVFQ